MNVEKLYRDNAEPEESTMPSYLSIAIVLAIVVMITLIWWRRKRLANALILLGLITPHTSAAELDAKGNWTVSHAPGELLRLSPCGFHATLFALEHTRTEYRLQEVTTSLVPTSEGVSLADIKSVLEAHGLETIAREQVTLPEFQRALTPGWVAIFPVKLNERQNHYLTAINSPTRGQVLIDPPYSVRALATHLTAAQFSSLGGVVIFARRPPRPLPMVQNALTFEPSETDFGVFRPDAPDYSAAFHQSITLVNKSDRAVLVQQIRTSCGCISSLWTSRIIPAQTRLDFPLRIIRGGWGPGQVTRTIHLELRTGEEVVARFTANTLSPEELHQIKVVPNILRIDLSKVRAGTLTEEERSVVLQLGTVNADQVRCTSSAPWLKVISRSGTANQLSLLLNVDPKVIGPFPMDAEVAITSQATQPPVRLQVNLLLPPRFRPEKPILQIPCKSDASYTIPIHAIFPTESFPERAEFVDVPAGLHAKYQVSAPSATIQLTTTADIKPGFYTLRCRLAPDQPHEAQLSVLVQVQKE
jgi:hypothetical protein